MVDESLPLLVLISCALIVALTSVGGVLVGL